MDKHLLELLNKTLDVQIDCIRINVKNGYHYDGKSKTIAQITETMAKKFIFYNVLDDIHIDINKSEVKRQIKCKLLNNIDLLRKYGMVK